MNKTSIFLHNCGMCMLIMFITIYTQYKKYNKTNFNLRDKKCVDNYIVLY